MWFCHKLYEFIHFSLSLQLITLKQDATTCYMEEEQWVDEVGDDYLTGLLYAETGRIYRLYYDYPKSLEAYRKAADCYERAGKIRHRNYMWYNQSTVSRNMNRYDESGQLLRTVLLLAKKEEDNPLIKLCLACIEQSNMSEIRCFMKNYCRWWMKNRIVGKPIFGQCDDAFS